MEFKTAGITFRIKENPEIAKLRPKGKVKFIPEPDNKNDKNGNIPIAIWYKDYHIGYVPSSCNANWSHKEGVVKECAYIDDEGVLNNNGKGRLVSVPIEIDDKIEILKFGDDEVTYDDNTHTYTDSQGKLLSASKLASQLHQDFDRLIMWAFDQGSYEGYRAELKRSSEEGTRIHDVCERAIKGEIVDHPVMNFIKDNSPKLISSEEIVYDKDIRVVGRYDAKVSINGKTVLIDWKNGTKKDKYWIQLAFYAKQLGADEMWIVSFKTKAKRGYSVSKNTDISKWYNIGTHLAKVYYLINK